MAFWMAARHTQLDPTLTTQNTNLLCLISATPPFPVRFTTPEPRALSSHHWKRPPFSCIATAAAAPKHTQKPVDQPHPDQHGHHTHHIPQRYPTTTPRAHPSPLPADSHAHQRLIISTPHHHPHRPFHLAITTATRFKPNINPKPGLDPAAVLPPAAAAAAVADAVPLTDNPHRHQPDIPAFFFCRRCLRLRLCLNPTKSTFASTTPSQRLFFSGGWGGCCRHRHRRTGRVAAAVGLVAIPLSRRFVIGNGGVLLLLLLLLAVVVVVVMMAAVVFLCLADGDVVVMAECRLGAPGQRRFVPEQALGWAAADEGCRVPY